MTKPKTADKGDKLDIHQAVTNSIIAAIEAGPGEYKCPWHRSSGSTMRPRNALTGKPYQGVNILSLWASGDQQGFCSGKWATYKQWSDAGAQVCKGAKSSLIVFYKTFEAEAESENDASTTRMFARASHVFAAEQVEGYIEPDMPVMAAFDPPEAAQAFISATGAQIAHGGSQAFYRPSTDTIQIPPREAFIGTETSSPVEAYLATIFHELGHWTSAKHRLDRELGKRFGDDKYFVEEVIAELNAAFLCADFGIANKPRDDHAQYLNGWLRIMKADPKMIFSAASAAFEAVRYLDALQPVRHAPAQPATFAGPHT